jgi:hypothetical protein
MMRPRKAVGASQCQSGFGVIIIFSGKTGILLQSGDFTATMETD